MTANSNPYEQGGKTKYLTPKVTSYMKPVDDSYGFLNNPSE